MTDKALTSREDAFCAAYVADPKRNGTAAAIAAGYAPRSARVTASRLLTRDNIRARISRLQAEAAEQARLTIEKVLDRYSAIVCADPNDLCSYEVAACRYCHGRNHAYQWRTPAEFRQALDAWKAMPDARRPEFPPDEEGGYGYSRKQEPHPDCPMCDGEGEGRVVLHDTRIDHPLFAGVRKTRHGVEIRMLDRLQALETIARILGAFDKENRPQSGDNGLGAYLLSMIRENRTQGAVLNWGEREEA